MIASPPRPPPDRRSVSVARALAVALALLAPALARAQSTPIHGRLELGDTLSVSPDEGLEAALGAREHDDALADLRLSWEPRWGPWSLSLQGALDAQVGPGVRLADARTGLAPAPPATWLGLSGNLWRRPDARLSAGLDRLAVGFATPDLVVRVGRQALTWGSGLVFRPMDLFDPFSPAAIDTEYKPGTDMLYVQRLFADGSDLQLILAPRPPRPGAAPTADASSAALHLRTSLLGHRTTWMLARDHGDWVGGVGVDGALGGATWNVELVPTGVRGGATRLSGVANISDAVTLFRRNATVFAEYFHNGFGAGGGPLDVSSLPADLTGRLARGQVFSLRRDYLATGLTLEVKPLLRLTPSLIADLDDGGLFVLFAADWALSDNLTLVVGAQAPLGPARSEFAGVPLSPGSSVTAATPTRVYVQLRRYF